MKASNSKTLDLFELSERLTQERAKGKTIVQAHGVFDLLHVGHIRYFEEASLQADILVVTVTPNHFVNKGPGRPAFSEKLRVEAIASLAMVDFVAINRWPTAVETIRLLRPDVYAKGPDYQDAAKDVTGAIRAEAEAVEEVGGRLYLTTGITFSSSNLINNFFSPYPPETEKYIRDFKARFSFDQVCEWVNRMGGLRPLVVGEPIIDEYVFCDILGKSTKDPTLAGRCLSEAAYAGGALAVANHLAGFCQEVGLIGMIGEQDSRESFVRSELIASVRPEFVSKPNSPTIHKRRFVDMHTGHRVFELYLMNDNPLDEITEEALADRILDRAAAYDLTVVSDYGHGMMARGTVNAVTTSARFLSVNTQANAGNRGFNTIGRYPKADYVCLTGHEVRLETRNRYAQWHELVEETMRKIHCRRFTITQGSRGTLHYEEGLGYVEAPALATNVHDRVGAGDSVLAVTSLLVAVGAPWEIVGFVANLAGAMMVAELGNKVTVNRVPLLKFAQTLLK